MIGYWLRENEVGKSHGLKFRRLGLYLSLISSGFHECRSQSITLALGLFL